MRGATEVILRNMTKYWACHEKWLSSFTRVTHEASCTMRGATGLTPQLVPATKNDSQDWSLSHWNVIYNARTNKRSSSNITKQCACHGKGLSWLILGTSFTGVTLQRHQILRLPWKMTIHNLTEICWKQLKRHLQCAGDQRMRHTTNCVKTFLLTMYTWLGKVPIREWSDHDPSMIRPWTRQSAFGAPAIIPKFTLTWLLFFALRSRSYVGSFST